MNNITYFDFTCLYPILTREITPLTFYHLPKNDKIRLSHKIKNYNALLLCVNRIINNTNHKLWLPIELWQIISKKIKCDITCDYTNSLENIKDFFVNPVIVQYNLFQDIYNFQRNF